MPMVICCHGWKKCFCSPYKAESVYSECPAGHLALRPLLVYSDQFSHSSTSLSDAAKMVLLRFIPALATTTVGSPISLFLLLAIIRACVLEETYFRMAAATAITFSYLVRSHL